MADHVHPTIAGHQLIAEAIWETMVKNKLAPKAEMPDAATQLAFAEHLKSLDETYFARGKQRLEGLRRWAEGRAAKRQPHD